MVEEEDQAPVPHEVILENAECQDENCRRRGVKAVISIPGRGYVRARCMFCEGVALYKIHD